MKHVTFIRDMKPYQAGGMALMPDELAAKLEAEGAIMANPPAWPPGSESKPVEGKPPRGRFKLPRGRDLLGQTYLTK